MSKQVMTMDILPYSQRSAHDGRIGLLHDYDLLGEPSGAEPYFQPTVAACHLLNNRALEPTRFDQFAILPAFYMHAPSLDALSLAARRRQWH